MKKLNLKKHQQEVGYLEGNLRELQSQEICFNGEKLAKVLDRIKTISANLEFVHFNVSCLDSSSKRRAKMNLPI